MHPRCVFLCHLLLIVCVLTACTAATTVDVERLFSRGRLILNHTRNRSTASRVCSLICLGNWFKHNLVADEDVRVQVCRAPSGTTHVTTMAAINMVD